MGNLEDLIKGPLDFVINRKFKVRVYDDLAEKLDTFDWSLQEISLFLMTNNNKIKRIDIHTEIGV